MCPLRDLSCVLRTNNDNSSTTNLLLVKSTLAFAIPHFHSRHGTVSPLFPRHFITLAGQRFLHFFPLFLFSVALLYFILGRLKLWKCLRREKVSEWWHVATVGGGRRQRFFCVQRALNWNISLVRKNGEKWGDEHYSCLLYKERVINTIDLRGEGGERELPYGRKYVEKIRETPLKGGAF